MFAIAQNHSHNNFLAQKIPAWFNDVMIQWRSWCNFAKKPANWIELRNWYQNDSALQHFTRYRFLDICAVQLTQLSEMCVTVKLGGFKCFIVDEEKQQKKLKTIIHEDKAWLIKLLERWNKNQFCLEYLSFFCYKQGGSECETQYCIRNWYWWSVLVLKIAKFIKKFYIFIPFLKLTNF